jgi:hypothetical protein
MVKDAKSSSLINGSLTLSQSLLWVIILKTKHVELCGDWRAESIPHSMIFLLHQLNRYLRGYQLLSYARIDHVRDELPGSLAPHRIRRAWKVLH